MLNLGNDRKEEQGQVNYMLKNMYGLALEEEGEIHQTTPRAWTFNDPRPSLSYTLACRRELYLFTSNGSQINSTFYPQFSARTKSCEVRCRSWCTVRAGWARPPSRPFPWPAPWSWCRCPFCSARLPRVAVTTLWISFNILKHCLSLKHKWINCAPLWRVLFQICTIAHPFKRLLDSCIIFIIYTYIHIICICTIFAR